MDLERVLNIFFPQKCSLCGKIGTVLCLNCEKEIRKLEINLIERESIKVNKNTRITVNKMYIFRYEGVIRNLLINYKFNDASYLKETFSKIILKNKKVCRFLKNYDIIIPVPLHKKRKLERGYNQTELISKSLKIIETESKCLMKTKNIKPQSNKNVMDRRKDIKGVYSLENIDRITGKKLLIFDDIYTTGSTINECIDTLKNVTKDIGILIIAKDYMEVDDGRFS